MADLAALGIGNDPVAQQQLAALGQGSVMADAALQLYMAQMGLTDQLDVADTRMQQDATRRRLTEGITDLQDAGNLAREQISNNYESRGAFRSGGHELALARQRAEQGKQAGRLTSAAGDDIAALELALARARLNRGADFATQAISTADRRYGGV